MVNAATIDDGKYKKMHHIYFIGKNCWSDKFCHEGVQIILVWPRRSRVYEEINSKLNSIVA